jgi:hypothetical protein
VRLEGKLISLSRLDLDPPTASRTKIHLDQQRQAFIAGMGSKAPLRQRDARSTVQLKVKYSQIFVRNATGAKVKNSPE